MSPQRPETGMVEAIAEVERRLEALAKRREAAMTIIEDAERKPKKIMVRRAVSTESKLTFWYDYYYANSGDPPTPSYGDYSQYAPYVVQEREDRGSHEYNEDTVDNPYVTVYSVGSDGDTVYTEDVDMPAEMHEVSSPEGEAILQDAETFGYMDMELGATSDEDKRYLTVEGMEAMWVMLRVALGEDNASQIIGPRGYIQSHLTGEQKQYLKDHPNRVVRTR